MFLAVFLSVSISHPMWADTKNKKVSLIFFPFSTPLPASRGFWSLLRLCFALFLRGIREYNYGRTAFSFLPFIFFPFVGWSVYVLPGFLGFPSSPPSLRSPVTSTAAGFHLSSPLLSYFRLADVSENPYGRFLLGLLRFPFMIMSCHAAPHYM